MIFCAALCILTWIGCQQECKEGFTLTFQVDMSEVELAEHDTVGIRGNVAPLTWTETYVMEGPDENGIYKVSIPFENVEYGTRVQYKYIYGDNNWDNDKYAEYGNRVATVCCNKQQLPVDNWDELEEYALETLLNSSEWDVFMSWIYTIATAKEHGLSVDKIAQENIDFWEWDGSVDRPENYLLMDKFYQAKSPAGYFEVLENSPEKVEYIKNKDWEVMLYQWDETGVVHGVTAEEMTTVFRMMMEYYVTNQGWTLTWQDMDDHRVKITIAK